MRRLLPTFDTGGNQAFQKAYEEASRGGIAIIGVDYGTDEGSTEVHGVRKPDGSILITHINQWRVEIDAEAKTSS
tara:strand:+ start:10776 stop:11000 length:225 start_codon:yes stop_codon:yes gene_type:complete